MEHNPTGYHTLWRDGRAPERVVQLAGDAVLNPVRIPPVDRVHRATVQQHREVQAIAAGEPCHAAPAERLSLDNGIADLDVERRQVLIERGNAHPVVEDDAVAINAKP